LIQEKLEFGNSGKDQVEVTQLVYKYYEGMQWVLSYYYHGVQSWEWFFPYHYCPQITGLDIFKLDLSLIDDNAVFEFNLGEPFRAFDQLMAVLPPLSKSHVPPCFQDLMTDPLSPIIDFYPQKFDLDMNGKKNDWEAIVKIPFIDEKRLLATIKGIFN
jgi:5'-3' exoribonuclease 1